MWTRNKLIHAYINFFKSKNHKEIPNTPLIPKDDPTVLFTTAGMHPLVPFLLGEKHPLGKRLCNVQKCLRTTDIEKIGDNFHLTFFEMLGNWSLGDYWKKEAIEWSYEFLTKILKIPKEKIYVSVFNGNKEIKKDLESERIWLSLIPKEKIFFLEDNFWIAGDQGLCGPCTEMFIDTGKPRCSKNCKPGCSCGKYFEIWNDVFMEYERKKRSVLLIDAIKCLIKDRKINYQLKKIIKEIEKKFKLKLIIVTNSNENEIRRILKDNSFDIFTLNRNPPKENPNFFKKILEKYKVKEKEILYFDHKRENIEAAKKVGILTFLYKGNDRKIKEFIEKEIYYYEKLKQKNVDTGMGVERTLTILNKKNSVFEIQEFSPIIKKIKEIAKIKNLRGEQEKSMRIIADHLRACVFILAEKIQPSNLDQGYVARRLIRRAIRHSRILGIKNFCSEVAEEIIKIAGKIKDYKYLEKNKNFILEELKKEEERFSKTLNKGMKEFKKILKTEKRISGKKAFFLYQSYGFPIELTSELAKENKIEIDIDGFYKAYREHQEKSRKATQKKFKSGLADRKEKTIKLHTATHLLIAALRKLIDKNIIQKGSNITSERLRLDFNFNRKLTNEEIKKVENLVNKKISEAIPVKREEMSLEEARKQKAEGVFEKRYGKRVSVYTIGDFSKEICAGPHVKNTKELSEEGKKFKIIKQESVGSGIRRIKAVLE